MAAYHGPPAWINNPPIRWEMGKMLGQGSFGKVYDGRSQQFGVTAVKQIIIPKDARRQMAMFQEVNLMVEMKNPYILSCFHAQRTADGFNIEIFLPKMNGDCFELAQERPEVFSDVGHLWHLAYQGLQGLKYLDKNNILHRDLKPENVLYCIEQGSYMYKLSDFGLSNRVEATSGTVCGTSDYMAPEIIIAQTRHQTSAADIWSFYVTLLWLYDVRFRHDVAVRGIKDDEKIALVIKSVSNPGMKPYIGMAKIKPEQRLTARQTLDHIKQFAPPSTGRQAVMPDRHDHHNQDPIHLSDPQGRREKPRVDPRRGGGEHHHPDAGIRSDPPRRAERPRDDYEEPRVRPPKSRRPKPQQDDFHDSGYDSPGVRPPKSRRAKPRDDYPRDYDEPRIRGGDRGYDEPRVRGGGREYDEPRVRGGERERDRDRDAGRRAEPRERREKHREEYEEPRRGGGDERRRRERAPREDQYEVAGYRQEDLCDTDSEDDRRRRRAAAKSRRNSRHGGGKKPFALSMRDMDHSDDERRHVPLKGYRRRE